MARQKDFYRLRSFPEGEDFLEKFFAGLEGKAAKVFRRIEEDRDVPERSSKDYEVLVNFIAGLAFRNPKTRKWSEEITKDMWKRFLLVTLNHRKDLKAERLKNFIKDERKYTLEVKPEASISDSLQMMKEVVPYLARRRWFLITSEDAEDHFITSDNPVCLDWTIPMNSFHPPGFAHIDTVVNVPLTRRVLMMGVFEQNKNYALIRRRMESGKLTVSFTNSAIISHADRFLFSPAKDFIWHADGKSVENAAELMKRVRKCNKGTA